MIGIGAWEGATIIMVLFVAATLAGIYFFWRSVGRGSANPDLVSCPNCRRMVSREYASCPECGYALATPGDPGSPMIGRPPAASQESRRPTV